MKKQPDILIVGGGAIGMTTALELADRGHDILLLEKNEVGKESSWAGAGLLFCFTTPPREALLNLIYHSVQLFPAFCDDLQSRTGCDSEYEVSGGIRFGTPFPTAQHEPNTQQLWHEADLKTHYPLLNAVTEPIFFDPLRAQIRNPRLLNALKQALLSHPRVTLAEGESVLSYQCEGSKVVSVETTQGRRHADHIVITAGAWSSSLLALAGVKSEIFPVRGQLLAFNCGEPVHVPITVNGNYYLVPRRDGIVLAGATMEQVGFDQVPTRAAFNELSEAAFQMMPFLKHKPLIAQWSGLRPGSEAILPFIGPVSSYTNLWVNTGHFRNGLVLSPISAQILADLMEHKTPSLPAMCPLF